MYLLTYLPNEDSDQNAHLHGPIKIFTVAGPVAQLDVRLAGDQEVAGSTPAKVGNILSWRLIVKYFLRSFSPFR